MIAECIIILFASVCEKYFKMWVLYVHEYLCVLYLIFITKLYIYIMMINDYIKQTSLFKTCYSVLKCSDIDFQIVCIRHSVHKIVNENVIEVTTSNIVVSPTGIVHTFSLSCKMDAKSKIFLFIKIKIK